MKMVSIEYHIDAMKPCLQCSGIGKLFFRSGRFVPCDICEGTGKADRSDLWEVLGLLMKAWRTEKELTLREAAKEYKVDPSNLSKMERGIMKPNPKYLKMVLKKESNL